MVHQTWLRRRSFLLTGQPSKHLGEFVCGQSLTKPRETSKSGRCRGESARRRFGMRRMPLWMLWTQSRSKQGEGGQRVLEIHWKISRSVLRGISVQSKQRLQSGILQGEIPQMRLQRPFLLLQVRLSLLRQAHQPAARRWTAKTREMKKAEAEAEPVGLATADRSLLAAIAKAQVLRHQAQLPRPASHEVAARAKVQAQFPRPTRRRTTTTTALFVGCPSSSPKSSHSLAKSAQPGSQPFTSYSATSAFVP